MPRKRIKRWFENTAVNWIASLLFIFGLSLIIPLWTYVFSPFRLFTLQFVATAILSGSLILASFALLKAYYRSRRKAYWHLSLTTIIPVILAIVLSFYPVDFFFAVISSFVEDATVARPLIEQYLENHVPKVASVIYAYAVLGVYFLIKSKKR